MKMKIKKMLKSFEKIFGVFEIGLDEALLWDPCGFKIFSASCH